MSKTTRATLYYSSDCPPCRWMSLLAVILSFGTVRRVSNQCSELERIYEQHPDRRGQVVLSYRSRTWFQRRVFAALPLIILGLLR